MLGSQSDLATIMGCSESYIGKLDRKGDPRIIKRAGKIDLDASAEALIKSGFGKKSGKGRSSKKTSEKGGGAYTMDDERLELEKEKIREQTRKLKFETDVKQGDYLEKAEVENYIFDRFRSFRDNMQAVPSRIGPRLMDQTQHQIERIMTDEIHKVLTDLANGVKTDFPGIEDQFKLEEFSRCMTKKMVTQMMTDLETGELPPEDRELMGFIDVASLRN